MSFDPPSTVLSALCVCVSIPHVLTRRIPPHDRPDPTRKHPSIAALRSLPLSLEASSSLAWASSPQRSLGTSPERVGLFGGLDDGPGGPQRAWDASFNVEDEDDVAGYFDPRQRLPTPEVSLVSSGLFRGSNGGGAKGAAKAPPRRASNLRSSSGQAKLQPLSTAVLATAAAAAAGSAPLWPPATRSHPPSSPSRTFHMSSRGGEDLPFPGLDSLPEETDLDLDLDDDTRLELEALREMWRSPGLYSGADEEDVGILSSNEPSEMVRQLISQAEQVSYNSGSVKLCLKGPTCCM